MKTFTVALYRDITERAFINIEAEDRDDAVAKVYNRYCEGDYDGMFEFYDETHNIEDVTEYNKKEGVSSEKF